MLIDLLAAGESPRQGSTINKFELAAEWNSAREPRASDSMAACNVSDILCGDIALNGSASGENNFLDAALA